MNSSRKKEAEQAKEENFLNTPSAAPKVDALSIQEAEEVAPPQPAKKVLQFQQVDTGDFEVVDFKTAGETLTARYEGTSLIEGFVDKQGQQKEMLIFRDYETGQKKVVNPSYVLEKFFVHKVSDTLIKWDSLPVFQITYTNTTEIKGGGTVKNFSIQVAYEF